MISLLDGRGTKPVKDFRALYRDRLEELAENTGPGATEVADSAGGAEPDEAMLPENVETALGSSEDMPAGSPGTLASDNFQSLAEQIAPKCIEALADAMRGMCRLAFDKSRENEDVINQLIALSDETRQIRTEISSLRQAADYLGAGQRESASKAAMLEGEASTWAASRRELAEGLQELAKARVEDVEAQRRARSAVEERMIQIERHLTERLVALETRATTADETASVASESLEAILHALEKQSKANASTSESLARFEQVQHVIERRLDAQAEALRAIHASEQGRSSQWEAALQSIKDAAFGCRDPIPLPEGL